MRPWVADGFRGSSPASDNGAIAGLHNWPREGRNPDPIPAFTSTTPKLVKPSEGAMERELTPVEVRGGVISGRIVTVPVISFVGVVIALAGAWAIVGSPT
jgi:hypothetical protein